MRDYNTGMNGPRNPTKEEELKCEEFRLKHNPDPSKYKWVTNCQREDYWHYYTVLDSIFNGELKSNYVITIMAINSYGDILNYNALYVPISLSVEKTNKIFQAVIKSMKEHPERKVHYFETDEDGNYVVCLFL